CKRGRPPGLKNKLKRPAANSTPYAALQTHVLQIPPSGDVAESIAAFARGCPALGVCLLSASGPIATAVLREVSPNPSTLTFQGSFDLLSITATFLPRGGIRSLAVILARPKGQVLGGVVAEQLVAACTVVVVAATFASPASHRMDKIDITLKKSMLPVVENKERDMLHKCLAEVECDLGLHDFGRYVAFDAFGSFDVLCLIVENIINIQFACLL
ncbi:AT-hook motif nuclear-localized protein 17-like, partial [Phalaenopsis equestris]|uniref:AT-hook motif nuclear-localized protein 17-like n=1 Tax=Phalaenopsis equestris TaxID=78828 RepID=UPI0009E1CB3A